MKQSEIAKQHQGSATLAPEKETVAAPEPAGRPLAEEPDPAPLFPRPLRRRSLAVPLAVALAALILIFFADPAYPHIYKALHRLPLKRVYATLNQFATVSTAALICLTIWTLDRRRRKTIVVFLVALLLSSTVNETIKQVTGRARPDYSIKLSDGNTKKIQQYLAKRPQAPIRAERRSQWMLFKPHRPYFMYGYSSFPSGHSNFAFTLAAYLSAVYPPARVVFLAAATGCAAARVYYRCHWPEDALFGAALGWMIAQLVFSWSWPMRLGTWLCERKRHQA